VAVLEMIAPYQSQRDKILWELTNHGKMKKSDLRRPPTPKTGEGRRDNIDTNQKHIMRCFRLSLFVFSLALIMSMAAAETVKVGNYSIEFNLSRPHEVVTTLEKLDGGKINGTYAELTIKTFDDVILIIPGIKEEPDPTVFTEPIEVDNVKGILAFPNASGAVYKIVVGDTFIASYLYLFETADFLRTLHIRSFNQTKG